MRYATIVAAMLLWASSPAAHAGLGESSSPLRLRCENQASAKYAMWQWFARRDFVQRCMNTTGSATKGGKGKKRVSAR
jgi:hypothetical protein